MIRRSSVEPVSSSRSRTRRPGSRVAAVGREAGAACGPAIEPPLRRELAVFPAFVKRDALHVLVDVAGRNRAGLHHRLATMSGELTPELLRRRPPPLEEAELHGRLARSMICGSLDAEAQRDLVLTRVWEWDEDPLLTAERQRRQVTTRLVVDVEGERLAAELRASLDDHPQHVRPGRRRHHDQGGLVAGREVSLSCRPAIELRALHQSGSRCPPHPMGRRSRARRAAETWPLAGSREAGESGSTRAARRHRPRAEPRSSRRIGRSCRSAPFRGASRPDRKRARR